MTIVDANILLYAYDSSAAQNPAAVAWLNDLFQTGETVGLPWVVIWAFLRVTTNPRLLRGAKPVPEIFSVISEWLKQPGIVLLNPGPLHADILNRLLSDYGVAGPMVSDAVIAALALEYGATVASTDQDFRRFPEVRWINPLNQSGSKR
ncbi:MAG TPA: TA system VapC family ribonuclease toxin [Bryobacteraceae bacterium]|nr:TA system VapC family ribonuclease toxin [Bryobacteraceae bacterium]